MTEQTIPSMTRRPYVFVLWGDKFEEETTTIFVTELRRVGIPVKVIGVNGPSATGLHGLTLRPDLTLGEAFPLAQQAICVVVPCDLGMFNRLLEDPRTKLFVRSAAENNALFVGNSGVIEQLQTQRVSEEVMVWVYPQDKMYLIEFAQNVANKLLDAVRAY